MFVFLVLLTLYPITKFVKGHKAGVVSVSTHDGEPTTYPEAGAVSMSTHDREPTTYPEAGAVSMSTHDREPIAGLVLATHSESNDGGKVVDYKVLEEKKKKSCKPSCKHRQGWDDPRRVYFNSLQDNLASIQRN